MAEHDYLYDGRGPVDPGIARLEALLRPHALRARPLRTRRRRPRRMAAAAALLLLALGGGVGWSIHRLQWPENDAWTIAQPQGDVRLDGRPLDAAATLAPGSELHTGHDGRVRVAVARIGELVLAPDTRVRLAATRGGHHRVEWLGGRLHARVWAPPGQFGVGIAGIEAIDLGCEFVVDGNGDAARLTVRSGWVQIDAANGDVPVPEGATVVLPRGGRPGTPHMLDAAPAFVAALQRIDAAADAPPPDGDDVRALLAAAQPRDAISLLSLLQRHPALARGPLFDRLQAMLPAAGAVSRDAVLARAPGALEPWWQALPHPRMKRWWLHWRDALPTHDAG